METSFLIDDSIRFEIHDVLRAYQRHASFASLLYPASWLLSRVSRHSLDTHWTFTDPRDTTRPRKHALANINMSPIKYFNGRRKIFAHSTRKVNNAPTHVYRVSYVYVACRLETNDALMEKYVIGVTIPTTKQTARRAKSSPTDRLALLPTNQWRNIFGDREITIISRDISDTWLNYRIVQTVSDLL